MTANLKSAGIKHLCRDNALGEFLLQISRSSTGRRLAAGGNFHCRFQFAARLQEQYSGDAGGGWGLTRAMAQEYVDVLKQLRVRMVEQRRVLAGRDADLGYSDTRTQSLVALQAAIEAVDRAIADELEIARRMHEAVPGNP